MQTDSTIKLSKCRFPRGKGLIYARFLDAMQQIVDAGFSEDEVAGVALEISIYLLSGNGHQEMLPASLLEQLVAHFKMSDRGA